MTGASLRDFLQPTVLRSQCLGILRCQPLASNYRAAIKSNHGSHGFQVLVLNNSLNSQHRYMKIGRIRVTILQASNVKTELRKVQFRALRRPVLNC